MENNKGFSDSSKVLIVPEDRLKEAKQYAQALTRVCVFFGTCDYGFNIKVHMYFRTSP